MNVAKDVLQPASPTLPYTLIWVEQRATGQYHFQGLHPAWEEGLGQDLSHLQAVAVTCLESQTPQTQKFTWGNGGYSLEFTPLTAMVAVGLVMPVLGENGQESLLGQVTDDAPVLIWLADGQGQITYVNRQWTVLTGWPVEMALGAGWFALVHPEDRAAIQGVYGQAVREGIPYRADFRVRCADGNDLWLACTGHPRRNSQGQPVGLIGACVEITARKQAEQLTQQQGDYNRFLVNLSTEILASLEMEPVMGCAVEQLQALLGVDRVAIAPLQPDGSLVFVVEAVSDPEFTLLNTQIQDHSFGEHYLELYRQGRMQVMADVGAADLQPCHREFLAQFGVQANLVLPIRHRERLWGLLILHHCQCPRPWSQGEIQLAQQVANCLGLALHRGELYEQLAHQEARYRDIVEEQSELICRHDQNGRLTFVNPALCRYLGQPAARVLQCSPQELMLTAGEQPLGRGDGICGWVQWQAKTITNDRGEILEVQWVGRDVTTAHQVQERLQLMESVVVCANDGIVITQGQRVIYANPTFLAMTGYDLAEIQNLGLGELCGEKTDLTQWEYIQKSKKQGASIRTELVQYTKNNQDLWVELTVLSLSGSAAERDEWVWVYRDITSRKQMEARLLYDAFHDALTGLPNRNFLMDQLHQAHQRSLKQGGTAYAVLFADLDRFKLVNDSLGHTAGDQMLQEIARRLRRHVRPGDTLARLGGDEFVVLLEPVAGVTEAEAVAERLLQELLQPFGVDGQELVLGSSIGVCLNDDPDYSPADILRNADIAMYQVKLGGRCGVQVFAPGMHDRVLGQLEMETALRRGFSQQEFVLHYQPVVQLERGQIVGFEALVRWQRPGVGLVSPGVFIPVAEESGLIYPLSQWVLGTACQQLAQWRTLRPDLTLAVNVSGRLFRRVNELVSQISQTLHRCGLPPQALVLEVTEGVLMADPQTVGDALSQLRHQGVQVSIDDFGTGYSSLGRLQGLPVDCLKIDRSFIQQMTQGGELVRAIVALAVTLNKDVVAEGIETPQQLALLQSLTPLSKIYGQGYWFARPLSAAAATALLQQPQPWGKP
ncbi:Putative signal transduction protein containing a membrane domain, an EAL and a GGDEF domain [Gloeomargarita lithophora Alchichica-D10]|uniref:Signal transduction protein containing a membrane domain, an EAL and a GGDEF domain n=1 Tax=Gloeomargarita lithophora Alchichica-D10 TaxID=1188229 RepID=A0A1J0A9W1_9CYAN|nr:EAL domain-containing protein [Gloeomargarita lithophora]APB32701.1 Putative signal transduction protein containing a membrane domain, an EAL and a GGDEF domain [Gloeomargarita lithophora Alchichica-D10]